MTEAGPQKSCFFVSPIGHRVSDTRTRADMVLRHIVRPACEECGFIVSRADELDTPGMITRRLIDQLLKSDLVIADLTGHNPNVFYEIGIRHATGLPIVQLCQDGEKLPFDVFDFTTIFFDHTNLDSAADCRARLVSHIKSFDGSKVVENPVTSVVGFNGKLLAASTSVDIVAEFERFTSQLLGEMRRLRDDRGTLFDTLTHVSTAPRSTGKLPELAGLWMSNIGPVMLIQNQDRIFGRYEFAPDDYDADDLELEIDEDSIEWTGDISGRIVDDIVVFQWHWINGMFDGVGYWQINENELTGGWFYQYEAPEYEKLVVDPHLIVGVRNSISREWVLLRSGAA